MFRIPDIATSAQSLDPEPGLGRIGDTGSADPVDPPFCI